MFDADAIDFREPVALFPLPTVSLLPHALQPLHVFEPRYRQMVEDALGHAPAGDFEHAAPIAMATFAGDAWRTEYSGAPALRPVVCVGRIVQHGRRSDGRHDIMLHGVARARILAMHEPEGGRAYRMAELVPLERMHEERPPMRRVRSMMHELLSRPRLGRVEAAKHVVGWFARADVPVHAAIEVAGYALVRDAEMRYRLLAEADPYRRAAIVRDAVMDLERTIALAERQGSDAWPKGQSWN
jgi:Lon protease-like protein